MIGSRATVLMYPNSPNTNEEVMHHELKYKSVTATTVSVAIAMQQYCSISAQPVTLLTLLLTVVYHGMNLRWNSVEQVSEAMKTGKRKRRPVRDRQQSTHARLPIAHRWLQGRIWGRERYCWGSIICMVYYNLRLQ